MRIASLGKRLKIGVRVFKPDLCRKLRTRPGPTEVSLQSPRPPLRWHQFKPHFIKALLIIVFIRRRRSLIKKCVILRVGVGRQKRKREGEGERETEDQRELFFFFPFCFHASKPQRRWGNNQAWGSCAFWQLDSADGLKGIECRGSRPFSRAADNRLFWQPSCRHRRNHFKWRLTERIH